MSEPTDAVIENVQKKLNLLSSSPPSNPKIFKVDHLRGVNEKTFDPKCLSIGPIHRHKNHVKDMEQHKLRYLDQLLKRKEQNVERYVMELRNLEEQARECYTKSILLDRVEFLQMLVIDGFFIIELVRKYYFRTLHDKNDYIFQSKHMLSQIRHDLLLFENQLPFFILNNLFDMTKTEDRGDNLHTLIRFFVGDMFPWLDARKVDSKYPHDNVDHLLGLVYSCYLFDSKKILHNYLEGNFDNINSLTELKEAGIKLKTAKGGTLLDLRFKNGVIELPPLKISDYTESLLRNLIAYEQFNSNIHPKYVTDYSFFMHCLMNSKKDAEILRRSGIISNWMGDDDTVYRMFNRLGTNVFISSDFCYLDTFQRVNRHCHLRHKTWMANLRQKYLNSPWAFLSVSGGIILLLLSLTQTVISVLSYINRNTH